MDIVTIDGAHGEGGGQILRTSASLAAITGRAVEVVNVRAKRSRPGLQPAHLMALRAAAAICGGSLEGDRIGSSRVQLEPGGAVRSGDYTFDVGTAGSTSLVLQSVLLPLALASGSSQVTVRGGTHNEHAPVFEYLERVYLPALRGLGVKSSIQCERAGHYPQGGGEVVLELDGGARLEPVVREERGDVRSLKALVVTSGLPEKVGLRGERAVLQALAGFDVDVERLDRPALSAGAAVVVVAACDGGASAFTGFGRRGKPMEDVAEDACREFLHWRETGAACDEHLADQLVLPATLAGGVWTSPGVSSHLSSVLWVVERCLPVRTELRQREGVVRVEIRRD